MAEQTDALCSAAQKRGRLCYDYALGIVVVVILSSHALNQLRGDDDDAERSGIKLDSFCANKWMNERMNERATEKSNVFGFVNMIAVHFSSVPKRRALFH